jgi:hypothetical protein
MNRSLAISTVVLLVSHLHIGQAQEQKAPPTQISKLEAIVGSFEGEVTMTEGGKTMKGTVRHTNSRISDGWGFLMDEVATMEQGFTYKSHNIAGYDAGSGKMHVFSVTTAGETHDHKGTWTQPNVVSVQYDGKWEGKTFVEKAVLTIDGPDAYTLSWNVTLGGKQAGGGMEKLHRVTH